MTTRTKPKLLLPLLLLLSFLLCNNTPLSFAGEDPELQLCKKQCERQQQFDRPQRTACKRLCEEYAKEKAKQQKEGGGRSPAEEDPESQREHCKHECRAGQLSEEEQRVCQQRCEEHPREGQEKGQINSVAGEGTEEKLHQCMHLCQSKEKDRHEQQQCRKGCEEQYSEERGGEQGMVISVF